MKPTALQTADHKCTPEARRKPAAYLRVLQLFHIPTTIRRVTIIIVFYVFNIKSYQNSPKAMTWFAKLLIIRELFYSVDKRPKRLNLLLNKKI